MSGGYCGPWWSDYQFQGSVAGYGPARSHFDQTCKDHDAAYARAKTDEDYRKADERFYQQNFGKSIGRSAAAVAVKHGGRFFHSRKTAMLRGRSQSNVTHEALPLFDRRTKSRLQYGQSGGYTSDFADYNTYTGNAAQKRKRPMSKVTPSPNTRSRHFSNKKARYSPYAPFKRQTARGVQRQLFGGRTVGPPVPARITMARYGFVSLPRVLRRHYARYKQARWRSRHYRILRARRLSLAYKRRAHFLKYRRARAYRKIAPAFRRYLRSRRSYIGSRRRLLG